jgi:preprotein translocase subunit SecG
VILNTLTIIVVINSFITLGLILSQNESSKDTTTNSTNTEISNPLQNLTWFCVFLEFILLLIKSKINDF